MRGIPFWGAFAIRPKPVHQSDSKRGGLGQASPVLVRPKGRASARLAGLVRVSRLKASIVPGWHTSCIATALANSQATFSTLICSRSSHETS